MARSKLSRTYRSARRAARRMKKRYAAFRVAAHEALFGKVWVRGLILTALLALAATAVVGMARVNQEVRPSRDMKWFLRQGGVEVAAPPLTVGSFQGAVLDDEEPETPDEEIEASASRVSPAADAFAFLGLSARAEEAMETLPPPERLSSEPDPNMLSGAEQGYTLDAGIDEDLPQDEDEEELPDADIDEEGEETFTSVADMPIAAEDGVLVTISAVGDCTLGGDAPHGGDRHFDQYVKKYGYEYFLKKVKAIFEADDLTIVNLEGPLTKQTKARVKKLYTFKGKPGYAKILSSASVEVCNIANNHALDYGEAGMKDTIAALDAEGIGSSGFGKVFRTEIRGVRVTTLGFTRWQYTAKSVSKAVKAARPDCDILIVCMHWGDEGKYRASKQQKAMGRAAIDAGADVVLGSHPHVWGGIEKYKGKYIVYSLSNFCFGGNGNPSDKRTFIFRQRFQVSTAGVEDAGIDIIPCAVTLKRGGNDFQPALLPMERAKLLLKNIAKYSSFHGDRVKWMEGSYLVAKGLVKGGAEPAANGGEQPPLQ